MPSGRPVIHPIPLARSTAFRSTTNIPKVVTIAGTDLGHKVTSGMKGFVVNKSINPVKWSNARLGNMAMQYSLYRPKQLQISWVPSCSATTPGNLVYGTSFGTNLTNNSVATDTAIYQLMSTGAGKMISVNAPHTWEVPLTHLPQKWFYVDSGHDVDSEPIRVMSLLVDAPTADTPLGYITFKYVYEFSEPIAQQAVEKEVQFTGTTTATTTANESLKMDLGTSYKYCGICFSEIGDSLKNYLTPGVQYRLGQAAGVATGIFQLLSPTGSPVIIASAAVAAAFVGMITYYYTPEPDPAHVVTAEVTHDEAGRLILTRTLPRADHRITYAPLN